MSELETAVDGIGHMLSDRLLAIPDFQRSYSWEADDQVLELYQDLDEAIAKNVSEYFLGSVVISQGDSRTLVQVIDGQQRLATVSVLYSALRDLFLSRSDERWQEIEHKVLGERDIETRQIQQRLTLNAEDNDFFRSLTLETPQNRNIAPTLASHQRLLKAHDLFSAKFAALIDGLGPDKWQQPLLAWYSFILTKAQVIEVRVSGEQRAFVIFETLNTRGLDLSTTDLLRNHLFGMSGGRLDEAKARWNRAFAGFRATDAESDADTFLRHFWSSKKGVVRVKALFSQIKPTVGGAEDAIKLLDELVECAPLWGGMFDRDADTWSGYRPGALAALEILSHLDVQQCRPLLLAAMRRLPQKEVEALLELVLGWTIRWFVVGGGSAGTVERLYAEAARKVTDGEIADAAGVAALFRDRVPADLAFKEQSKIMTVRRGWLARYYLSALERARGGDPEPELVPNENVEEVNLEHVLPRNPDPTWSQQFTAEEIQSMRLMLGNQLLLRKSQNAKLGNKSFAEKKPTYLESDLLLTNQVGELDSWGPDEIRDRQEQLADLAVTIWRG